MAGRQDTDLAVVVAHLLAAGWERGSTYSCGTTIWYLPRSWQYPSLELFTEALDDGTLAYVKVRREPRRRFKSYKGLIQALDKKGW